MKGEPTERQVLYGLVAAGWFVAVAALAAGAAGAGVSPSWWTMSFGVVWTLAAVLGMRTWRRTGRLLTLSVVVFIVWAAGTLLTR